MSHADLQTYLVELLMKQDQMSMAASIESRVPFLDHELVEHVAAMPSRFKLRGWRTKAVLREALRGLVPPEILTRPQDGLPGARRRLAARGLLARRRGSRAGPARPRPRPVRPRPRSGGWWRSIARGRATHGDRLWLLINLEIWQRIFLDGDEPAPVPRRVTCASSG